MDIYQHFEAWRAIKRTRQSWGLAWFLANQFARRYYASHGIAPSVIEREGLGFYGILLRDVKCAISGIVEVEYGRMTIVGDIENWRKSGPGGDRLRISDLCDAGEPTESLVARAIGHMGLPTVPSKSHYNCRHKRWGASWELCFEIATHLALRHDANELRIWNDPFHVEEQFRACDPSWEMKEHPGAFLFQAEGNSLLLAGDGRLFDGSGRNAWTQYMEGATTWSIARMLEAELRIC